MEKKYSISETLKFVLLPDGNTSDVEDESENKNEHLFEKSDDDNDIQNDLPKKIGCLELESMHGFPTGVMWSSMAKQVLASQGFLLHDSPCTYKGWQMRRKEAWSSFP